MTPAPPFCIQGWLVEPALHQVSDATTSVRLAPKFIQVLVCLAERPGEVVTRDELLDRVWAETVVGEAVLTRAVSELRKVFGDDPREPQVIETILKTGYRLMVPVELATPASVRPILDREPARASARMPGASSAWQRAAVGVSIALAMLVVTIVGLLSPSPESVTGPPTEIRTTSLTSYIGEEYDPALSPDGEHVAFIWKQQEGANYVADLYVQDVEGNGLLQLTSDPAQERHPAWSPDGSQLAFVRCDSREAALYVVPAAGGLSRKLTDLLHSECGELPSLTWSPDGAWIAFADQAGPQGPYQVAMLSVDTLERHAVTTPPQEADGDRHPVFSPNGELLAFTRDRDGTRGVYVIPAAGGIARPLTPEGRAVEGLDWTADGKHVVFASDGQLWDIALAGGPPIGRGTSDRYRSAPSTARANARLAYEQALYDVNIYALPLSTGSDAQPILTSTRVDGDPRIAPDGEHIAFVSDRSGACGLWVARRDGSQPTLLTTLSSYCMTMAFPRWSPDGRHVAYIAQQDGQQEIYTISMAGQQERRITYDPADDTMPSWSADGTALYFASNRSGQWEVWRQPVGEGDAEQVTSGGGYVAFESPDGQHLYFSRPNEPGVWRQPSSGGAVEAVFDALTAHDALNWRVVDGGFYYIDRTGSAAVAFYDMDEREVHRLAAVPTPSCLRADIAPDGSWAAFAQIDHGGRDLVLDEPRSSSQSL